MKDRSWPGIATAVACIWIISNIVWVGIAGPIWKATSSSSTDAWIGFAGNVVSAAVALLAAIVAGVAAYFTIKPMRKQLAELVRQNGFAHYERLRVRVADLWDQRLRIEKVNADLEVMDVAVGQGGLGAREGREAAFERLETSATGLNVSRRLVWGDANAQSLSKFYVDSVLIAANAARRSIARLEKPFDLGEWKASKIKAFEGGVALWARINLEIEMLSDEIARLEPAILSRAPFPQLWAGNYPGPKELARNYDERKMEAYPSSNGG